MEGANALIEKDNPDAADDKMAYSIMALNKSGIVQPGETPTLGVSATTGARWPCFSKSMTGVGAAPAEAFNVEFRSKSMGEA